VICNEGFTIERFIHGMDAVYNDIQLWRHLDLPSAFGAKEGATKTHRLKTKDDVQQLFTNKAFNAADKLQLIEVYIPKEDAPRALVLTAEASAKTNARQEGA
jgi:pyruvate decarboxylase